MILDTEYVGSYWCPKCQPDRDPIKEILETRYCGSHEPSREGSADGEVVTSSYLSGSAEAGGPDNQAFCAFIHGRTGTPIPSEIPWEGVFSGGE